MGHYVTSAQPDVPSYALDLGWKQTGYYVYLRVAGYTFLPPDKFEIGLRVAKKDSLEAVEQYLEEHLYKLINELRGAVNFIDLII